MTRPYRCFIICRLTVFVISQVPLRFTRRTASNSSSDIRMRRLSRVIPALLTRMSTRPRASRIRFTPASTWAGSLTSSISTIPLPPAASIAARVSRAPASLPTSLTTTVAPSAENASAIARPIPRAEPVTSATFPESRIVPPPIPKVIPSTPRTVQGELSPEERPHGGKLRGRAEGRHGGFLLDAPDEPGEDLPRPHLEETGRTGLPHPADRLLPPDGSGDLPDQDIRHRVSRAVGGGRHVRHHGEPERPLRDGPELRGEALRGRQHQGAMERGAHGEGQRALRAGRLRRLARRRDRLRAPRDDDLVAPVEVRRRDDAVGRSLAARRFHAFPGGPDPPRHRALPH